MKQNTHNIYSTQTVYTLIDRTLIDRTTHFCRLIQKLASPYLSMGHGFWIIAEE